METTAEQELLKPIIIDNHIIEGYSISKDGIVYSHYRRIGFQAKGTIDYSYRKPLKTRILSGYLSVEIGFVAGKLDYKYRKRGNPNANMQHKTCRVHQLVMDAWKPFSQFLPKGISRSDYNKTPESIQQLLPKLFYINHKDHNKLNNHIDNLERVTPRENTRKAKKHYNGNFANIKSQ
jgi:ribosomal protein S18